MQLGLGLPKMRGSERPAFATGHENGVPATSPFAFFAGICIFCVPILLCCQPPAPLLIARAARRWRRAQKQHPGCASPRIMQD